MGTDAQRVAVAQKMGEIIDRALVHPVKALDAADQIIEAYEAAAPRLDPSIIPLDDLSELRMSAVMIRRWIPEVFPENAAGQVHFVRAICDSVATAIERATSHLPKDPAP